MQPNKLGIKARGRKRLIGVHKLQRYLHAWKIWYNLVVLYCVSIYSTCLS